MIIIVLCTSVLWNWINLFLYFPLGDEEDIEEMKHLEPSEIKPRMNTILESMDLNKNGFIEKKELLEKLLDSYR